MATFSILVDKSKMRKDGSYPISIKLQWLDSNTKGHIPTGLLATKKQISVTETGALKLTSSFLIRILSDRIKLYEDIVKNMGMSVYSYNAGDLAKFVFEKATELTAPKPTPEFLEIEEKEREAEERKQLSLTDFARDFVSKEMELNEKKKLNSNGSAGNIKSAMSSIHRFAAYLKIKEKKNITYSSVDKKVLGEMTNNINLSFDDITVEFLDEYSHWMLTTQGRDGTGVKGRGLQLNLGHLNQVFQKAERIYNNKRERIFLVFNPLEDYKIPKPPLPEKRALNLDQLRLLWDYKPKGEGRAKLAYELSQLSFYLIGMNSVDLYTCPKSMNEWITYNRSKTKHRRDDKAEFSLRIPPEAIPILEQYADKEYLLNVHKRYSTVGTFNTALNIGMKQIGCDIERTRVMNLIAAKLGEKLAGYIQYKRGCSLSFKYLAKAELKKVKGVKEGRTVTSIKLADTVWTIEKIYEIMGFTPKKNFPADDIENLTFYVMRHSWATLAENSVGIDSYLVQKCLNHTDEKMKMTNTYIKQDWRKVNKANRAVIDFLKSGVEEKSDAA